MPKKFYTERDIDALHAQGVTRLDVDTNTVITALAKDRMTKLGMGINAAGAAQTPGAGHYGLLGMRERARLMGGSLSVHSAPERGTCVQLVAPAMVSTG